MDERVSLDRLDRTTVASEPLSDAQLDAIIAVFEKWMDNDSDDKPEIRDRMRAALANVQRV